MFLLKYSAKGNIPFIKMAANEVCPTGTEITSESRCQEAYVLASSLGLNPGRPLQVGNWQGVPYQCSAQVGLYNGVPQDESLHYSTNSQTNNARFTTGEFVMICEAGTKLIVFCLIQL